MDNATLTKAVRAELKRIGAPPTIEAKMADGIVTLSGSVAEPDLSRRLEQQLLALPEVLDVHNYLDVRSSRGGLEEQLRALLAREGVAADDLRVTVENGVVTLSGQAASWFDRDAMGRLPWRVPGVREVINRVSLPPGAVEPDRDDNGDLIP